SINPLESNSFLMTTAAGFGILNSQKYPTFSNFVLCISQIVYSPPARKDREDKKLYESDLKFVYFLLYSKNISINFKCTLHMLINLILLERYAELFLVRSSYTKAGECYYPSHGI